MESGASEKEKNEWWLQGFCHDRWKDGAATKSNGRAWRGSMFGEKNWDFTSEQVVFGLSIRWLLKIENIGLWIQGKKKHIVDAVNYQHEQYWPNYRSKVKFTERRLIIHVYSNEFLKLMIYATVRTQMITSWPFGSYHPPQTEKAMAPHSSTLAWKIPWTEEPVGLQSMGSQRVRHDWATSLSCIEEGTGNPLHCSCLEKPRDGEAWWAAIYGVAQSRTRLKQLSSNPPQR